MITMAIHNILWNYHQGIKIKPAQPMSKIKSVSIIHKIDYLSKDLDDQPSD